MVDKRVNQQCPDVEYGAQLDWIDAQLVEVVGRRRAVRLAPDRWRIVFQGHKEGRRQRVYLTTLEDVDGDADLHPDILEPCVQVRSPFLTLGKAQQLDASALRRALKYSATADHVRVSWSPHPEGRASMVLAATHTLFFEDLDTVELAAALNDIAHHADRLESMFSKEDVE